MRRGTWRSIGKGIYERLESNFGQSERGNKLGRWKKTSEKRILGRSVPHFGRIQGGEGREGDDRPNLAFNFKRLVPAARRRKGEREAGEKKKEKKKKKAMRQSAGLGDRIC